MSIEYTVRCDDPAAHEFLVEMEASLAGEEALVLRLPTWIPGSYLIREFARHLLEFEAEAVLADGSRRPLAATKIDKCSWRIVPPRGACALRCRYRVWAFDASVREAWLDTGRGFFNGTSLFLRLEGRSGEEHRVRLLPPSDPRCAGWKVATALEPAEGTALWSFGDYRAPDYDALIDAPVLMGPLEFVEFRAGGVPHTVALTGHAEPFDRVRLAADLTAICTSAQELFGEVPFARYLFLLTLTDEGYGGLEHGESTALLAARRDLPWPGMGAPSDEYVRLLGLFSHEYFHAWVVKRLKPAAFTPYDLFAENYTRLLWLFEGWTSYYDDLLLVRAGVIDADRYLGLLAKTATQVLTTPGRLRQSLAEASFDAWIKFYRPDENSANATVSYYAKGALLALALDLQLRERGASLDALLRALWERYGRSGEGMGEEAPFAVLHEMAGSRLARWLERMVQGTEDPPLAALLRRFGVQWREIAAALPDTGLRFERDSMRVAAVRRASPAEGAGIAPRDELVAIDRLKATPAQWESVLRRRGAGARVPVHAFREGRLYEAVLELAPPALERVELALAPRPTAQQRKRLNSWLRLAAP